MSDVSEPITRRDIEAVARQVAELHESIRVVGTVSEGLHRVGGTVTTLMRNLELASAAQQNTEEARRIDAHENRKRFWYTLGGLLLANIIVITISIIVLVGQIDAREESDARSTANRDRQSCATSLLVEWDEKLGNALRVTTQLPPVPRDSPEYQRAVNELNAATELIGHARDLCYGAMPNPNPVPGG